jgi:hypothetical protein
MILSPFDGLRTAFENLNDREKKLVGALGVVLGVLLVLLPVYLSSQAIGSIEDENEEIREVLRDISRARGDLAQRQAEREAAERRYDTPAPPLGSFLEAKARDSGYSNPLQVTDEPDDVGETFTRRHVRASLPGVGLGTAIHMMTEIENSPYPVAIELIQVDHTVIGQDRFNVQVGVFAFDRNQPRSGRAESDDDDGGERRTKRGGMVGPPAP